MNKEIFYCSLDQSDHSDQIINTWTDHKNNCNIRLKISHPVLPLINFDRFKGSFLRIKDTATMNVETGENDLIFRNKNFTFNFFLNTNLIKYKSKDGFILFGFQADEYVIKYHLKAAEQGSMAKIGVEYTIQESNSAVSGPVFLDTEIETGYDSWYNFNLEISPSGKIELSVIHTHAILNSHDPGTDSSGKHSFLLSEKLNTPIQLAKVQSLTFGEEKNNGELGISDLYIFEGMNAEEINPYIERGINISSKYSYRAKIGFDIFTLHKDKEYKGIHIIDRNGERYVLRLSLDHYSFTKRNADSKITLKFKKGFLNKADPFSESWNIKEDHEEIHILLNMTDGQLEYRLPDLRITNVTNTAQVFVQCEISGVTIFENNNPVEVCDYLTVDHLIPATDLSRKSSVPFEIMVLEEQGMICGAENTNSFMINIINTSDNDIIFSNDPSLNSQSRLKLNSRFWNQLIKENSSDKIKIDIQKFDESRKIFVPAAEFAYQYKTAAKEVAVSATGKSMIKPDGIIRLCISGLKFNELTPSFPAGKYPFFIKFENVQNYNDGVIPFRLNLKAPPAPKIPELPVGSIIAFYSSKIPEGWLLCDGSSINAALYPELYNLLPYMNKKVPDLRNRFLPGAGGRYSLGETGGADEVVLGKDQMPAHNHQLKAVKSYDSPFSDKGMGWARSESLIGGIYGSDRNNGSEKYFMTISNSPVQSEGGGKPHENRPPYHAVTYIIKAK
ncbi:tail fiber protein [Chryseobacterium sp. JJR-5R]|uniref:phage tail protein n=1 Tax=Chryseobacterium sp. JJR-5R TaxID=3093923 RepID=UPI002A7483DE|nr:tail fiber protein [Chryseobacterium sp. JJR-5R]WPO81954.1 tail fiber protein [Chryseobacterium sp. JJR-5R]